MARIEGLRRAGSLLTRLAFRRTRRGLGGGVEPVRLHARQSGLLSGYGKMEGAQSRARTVPAAMKSLAQIRVAMAIGSPFRIDLASAVGRGHGISEEKLQGLADFEASPAFTEEEKVVLRYAEAMTRTPVQVEDRVFQDLQKLNTDEQIVELTSALAWQNYQARFDRALGVEAEGFSGGSFCPSPLRAQERARPAAWGEFLPGDG